jgi:hypothetical protein
VDPQALEVLSELLLPHLQRLVEEPPGLPPLKLELCASVHQVRGLELVFALTP